VHLYKLLVVGKCCVEFYCFLCICINFWLLANVVWNSIVSCAFVQTFGCWQTLFGILLFVVHLYKLLVVGKCCVEFYYLLCICISSVFPVFNILSILAGVDYSLATYSLVTSYRIIPLRHG